MMVSKYFLILGVFFSGLSMSQTIINFQDPLKTHYVVTDSTERSQGKSHGDLSYQVGIKERKHYFFAFLEPQPNGAAFVSVYIPIKISLDSNQTLCLTAMGLQESPVVFQLIIETSTSREEKFTYQQKFTTGNKKTTYKFPLQNFTSTYRGQHFPDSPKIDASDIQAIGIRIIGRETTHDNSFQKGLYGLSLFNLSVCE
ncbi:MAG: CIA30 family protein [Legionellaceae bacterium]|nr:CIA30 family protein [Legionellaceae bacterium]